VIFPRVSLNSTRCHHLYHTAPSLDMLPNPPLHLELMQRWKIASFPIWTDIGRGIMR
jgi:hypothetical protein